MWTKKEFYRALLSPEIISEVHNLLKEKSKKSVWAYVGDSGRVVVSAIQDDWEPSSKFSMWFGKIPMSKNEIRQHINEDMSISGIKSAHKTL